MTNPDGTQKKFIQKTKKQAETTNPPKEKERKEEKIDTSINPRHALTACEALGIHAIQLLHWPYQGDTFGGLNFLRPYNLLIGSFCPPMGYVSRVN